MLAAVTGITFVATVLILMALVYAFTPGDGRIAARLEQLASAMPRVSEERFAHKQKERARDLLAKVGALLPAAAGVQASRAQTMMLERDIAAPTPHSRFAAQGYFCPSFSFSWFCSRESTSTARF